MLLVSVILIFAFAAAAPLLRRLVGGHVAAYILALAPLAIFVWLLSIAGGFDSTPLLTQIPWAQEFGLRFDFALDGLSGLFALLITGIGVLVVLYSGPYLGDQPRSGRFYLFLMLFMGAMLGVVLADNMLLLFIFWEMTSVSSYLLIGYQHERPAARRAALQALLVTALGGLALLAAIILIHLATGSWRLSDVIANPEPILDSNLVTPIVILVFLAAFTKSAQFPFHFWLPNAMEAPTPVSAYLHSSTMVKAGVYLLARLHPALQDALLWTPVLTIVGAFTMVFMAYLAIRECQLKRMLAYSTASALGVLVFLIGLGTESALFAMTAFLITHALYKGALFLVAGSMSYATGEKSVTKLRGLRKAMPATFAAAILAGASMAGIPLLFGFVGKELVMDATWHAPQWRSTLVAAAVAMAALTVTVALLVSLRPFIGAQEATSKRPREVPWPMLLGPGVLSLLSLVAGVFPNQVFGGLSRAASSSVGGHAIEEYLAIWHGIGPPLYMSVGAIALGFAIFVLWAPLRRLMLALKPVDRIGPESAYDATLAGLNSLAQGSTAFFQNGYLRFYVFFVLFTVIGVAVGIGQLSVGLPDFTSAFDHVRIIEAALMILIVAGTLVAVRSKSRLGAVAALGVSGYAITMFYVLFGAPDLALTQFSIETLIVILLVLVLYRLPRFAIYTGPVTRLRDTIIASAFGALMTVLVLLVLEVEPLVGFDPISTAQGALALAEGKGRNVVNVIIVDFRAIDTLGEITVLSIAAVGVYILLRFNRDTDPIVEDAT